MADNTSAAIAASVLLRRGLRDDVIRDYLARTWPLSSHECDDALTAGRCINQYGESATDRTRHPATGDRR